MKRFRGGLVFKAHRLLYHSTLGLRVIKKKTPAPRAVLRVEGLQGYLVHKKQPPPLGPPYDPRYSPPPGSPLQAGVRSTGRGEPCPSQLLDYCQEKNSNVFNLACAFPRYSGEGRDLVPCSALTGARKVDVRLHGKGNSNSHGARPVHLIIKMIKWIRTSRLSIKNSLSL